MQIGIIGKYPSPEFEAKIGLYKEMGVDVLDIQTPKISASFRGFVSKVRDLGIPVASIAPRWNWIDSALQNPTEVDVLLEFIREMPGMGIHTMNMACSFIAMKSAEEQKENLTKIIATFKKVTPAAEDAGVTLCSHTSMFRPGVLFSTIEGVEAFLEGVGSPSNKLLLCTGCVSAGGHDVPALVRRWREYLGSIHYFNPSESSTKYSEMRFDQGQMDIPAVMSALKEVGFDGLVIPHEYPSFLGPSGKEVSDGWTMGYLIALRQTLGFSRP
jgi:D-mannonate dehydratase